MSQNSTNHPMKQTTDLPKDVLAHLAEEFGLDPTEYKTVHHLSDALQAHRGLIATQSRDAMLDIVKWGRRPVAANASLEQLAREIAKIKSMRFNGLSDRGLETLARLRGLKVPAGMPVPLLIRRLKKQEGFFERFARKRRAWIGSMVANMIGGEQEEDYQFLPPSPGQEGPVASRSGSLKDEIEQAGLIGGIAGRLKRTADDFLHQKMDEIETRIDRKLDEIDNRLAEWRDKEIANRIRILKITLWASVIVAGISLLISYLRIVWQNVK